MGKIETDNLHVILMSVQASLALVNTKIELQQQLLNQVMASQIQEQTLIMETKKELFIQKASLNSLAIRLKAFTDGSGSQTQQGEREPTLAYPPPRTSRKGLVV